MSQAQEETERELDRWLAALMESGLTLAALAAVRREEATAAEAACHLTEYTAGMMVVDEGRLARVLVTQEQQGNVERVDGRYRITANGKRYMFVLLKQWNRYVDSMNNLWGCYYGT
ncbi:MAG TPA: hypothetical protein VLT35_02365 [Methanocella sp.]|nr:hypothetical protein [Methanocella sp.]